jgi:Uma2 family endonuclease
MARKHAAHTDETVRIPPEALTFEGFRKWSHSPEFPDRGRIDYLAGHVEADLSPEDLYTHGTLKVAISSGLHALVEGRLGHVFSDSTRIASRFAGLSVEPDVVVVLWDSLRSGRLRHVPAAGKKPNRYVELEGAPDVVVEVVSDGSLRKDTERLPPLYARAGIPELWLADARGEEVWFQILTLEDGRYVPVEADAEGWIRSPRLGVSFRLVRYSTPVATWSYVLERREG